MEHVISLITLILLSILGITLEIITFIDGLLGSALTSIGVPLHAQQPILILAAIILAIAALQLLGRFVAALLLILFILLLIGPHMHMHQPPAPAITGPHVTM